MKYLISHRIRILANCLENYKYVWDIIPIILRTSFENPKLGMNELRAKGWLEKYVSQLNDAIKGLESIYKDKELKIVLERTLLTKDVFKMADNLKTIVTELNYGGPFKSDESNELLSIVSYIYNKMSPLFEEAEKKRKEGMKFLTEEDISIIERVQRVGNFPYKVMRLISEAKKRKLVPEGEKLQDYKKDQEILKEEFQKGPEGKTAKREIKVYLDMDDCICDFDKAVKKLGPKAAKGLSDDATPTEEEKQYMYDKIEEAGPEFWSEMEWYSKGEELWKIVKKYDPVLLSSPGKFLWAPGGKQNWVNQNLPGISVFLESDKFLFAEMDSVLIDDSASNIESWKDAGGLGILYQGDPEMVKEELKKVVNQPG